MIIIILGMCYLDNTSLIYKKIKRFPFIVEKGYYVLYNENVFRIRKLVSQYETSLR